jgi:hypothetical protein
MYKKTYWRGDNTFFINLKKILCMIFFLQHFISKQYLLMNRSVDRSRCEADVIMVWCGSPYSSTHDSTRWLYPYGSMVGWTLDRVEGSYVLRMYYLVHHGSYTMHAYNRKWVTYRDNVGILDFGLGLTPI